MRPRIRSVKPEMRKDERYGRLSIGAREFFNGLITIADDEGRFRALSSLLCGDIFPYDNDAPRKLRGWVKEVQDSGMVLFYIDNGVPYGAFRHWKRHQRINRPTPSVLPPPPDRGVVTENGTVTHDSFSESSVNDHGGRGDQITTQSSGAHSLARRRAFRSDPFLVGDELQNSIELSADRRIELLCELLGARIVANDAKAKPAVFSDRWLTDMRRLLTDRNDDWQEVQRIIDWCQADHFWRSNILAPGKLRAKFTQLGIKASTPSKQPGTISDLDRKRLEAINRLVNQGGDAA